MTDQTAPDVTDDDRRIARDWAEHIINTPGTSLPMEAAAARVILNTVPAPALPTRWTLYWMTGDRQVVEGPDIATAMNCAGYGAGALAALDFYAKGDGDHGYRWSAADRDWVKKDDPDLFG